MDPLALGVFLFGSGSLIGLWAGHRLQLRREHTRWLLDQRITAYANYLGMLDAYLAASLAMTSARKEDTTSKELLERFDATLLPFSNARERVLLLGSDPTIEAVKEIQKALRVESVREVSFVQPYVDPTRFIQVARRDLRLSSARPVRSLTVK